MESGKREMSARDGSEEGERIGRYLPYSRGAVKLVRFSVLWLFGRKKRKIRGDGAKGRKDLELDVRFACRLR